MQMRLMLDGDGAGKLTLGTMLVNPTPDRIPPAIEPTKAQVEEVRKTNQEAVAALAEMKMATIASAEEADEKFGREVPVQEKVEQAVIGTHDEPKAAVSTPPEEQNAPTVTLENYTTVPYPALLEFCILHPEIGVDASKCGPSFFRKLVETRVKNFLESK